MKYPVVALCGSSRFQEDFIRAQENLTLNGYIVLSLGLFSGAQNLELETDVKEMLSKMHRQKIDMADSVYVINRDGYIGESTADEIVYAESVGKPVVYLCQ